MFVLSICLSVRLCAHLCVCVSVSMIVCLSAHPSVCLSVCLSACLFICFYVYPSLHTYTSVSLCVPCFCSVGLPGGGGRRQRRNGGREISGMKEDRWLHILELMPLLLFPV